MGDKDQGRERDQTREEMRGNVNVGVPSPDCKQVLLRANYRSGH